MVIGTSSGVVEALRRLAGDARQQARIIRKVLTEGTTEAV
jgi:hypothetical protein